MMRGPEMIVARLIIVGLAKVIKPEKAIPMLFTGLLSLMPTLIKSVGVKAVFQFLWKIPALIVTRCTTLNDPTIAMKAILDTLNPYIVQQFILIAGPYWKDCMKSVPVFTAFYYVFGFLFSSGLVRPFVFRLGKAAWTIAVSGFGIASRTGYELFEGWTYLNAAFSLFYSLIPGVDFSFFTELRNSIKQSRASKPIGYGVDHKENPLHLPHPDLPLDPDSAVNYLFLLSVIFAGVLAISALLVVGDTYVPDQVRSVPGIPNTLDGIYWCYNTVLGWFTSNPGPTPPSNGGSGMLGGPGMMAQAPLRVETGVLPTIPDAGVDSTASWGNNSPASSAGSVTPTNAKPDSLVKFSGPVHAPSPVQGTSVQWATPRDVALNRHVKS